MIFPRWAFAFWGVFVRTMVDMYTGKKLLVWRDFFLKRNMYFFKNFFSVYTDIGILGDKIYLT